MGSDASHNEVVTKRNPSRQEGDDDDRTLLLRTKDYPSGLERPNPSKKLLTVNKAIIQDLTKRKNERHSLMQTLTEKAPYRVSLRGYSHQGGNIARTRGSPGLRNS